MPKLRKKRAFTCVMPPPAALFSILVPMRPLASPPRVGAPTRTAAPQKAPRVGEFPHPGEEADDRLVVQNGGKTAGQSRHHPEDELPLAVRES
jgi:hypothetical protein